MDNESIENQEETLNPEILGGITPFSGFQDVAGDLISSGKALEKVETKFYTAIKVQEPRSIAKITNNVLAEAKLAGKEFYWTWPVNTKKGIVQIEGPSVDLAMCIARNYGNCAVPIDIVETPTHFLFYANFVDLETGYTLPRLFRQRKSQDIGDKYDDDRAEDMIFQIGQSKAQRNAITKAMPGWLVKEAIRVAKESALKKIKEDGNINLSRANAIEFFARYGIEQSDIEKKIGRKADSWTAEDIANLHGMAKAVQENRITAQELFPKEAPKPNGDTSIYSGSVSGKPGQEEQQESQPKNDWIEEALKKRSQFEGFVRGNIGKINALPMEERQRFIDKWAEKDLGECPIAGETDNRIPKREDAKSEDEQFEAFKRNLNFYRTELDNGEKYTDEMKFITMGKFNPKVAYEDNIPDKDIFNLGIEARQFLFRGLKNQLDLQLKRQGS